MQLQDDQVTTQEVKGWQGLHLLHFRGSSCSQKVRILLAEKGVGWESHEIDLAAKENTKPWFLGVNPRGVVPVLVHDGVVHVESNDIMAYIDALPSASEPFFPTHPAERERVEASLQLEDSLHNDLRNITLGFLFPGSLVGKSQEEIDRYESAGIPDENRTKEVAWWRAYAEQGVTAEQARGSLDAYVAAFAGLDAQLGEAEWLLGDRISVLEVAWFISVHRLARAGYPLERHPRLSEWYQKLLGRPTFHKEGYADTPGLLAYVLAAYQWYRYVAGTSLMQTVEA